MDKRLESMQNEINQLNSKINQQNDIIARQRVIIEEFKKKEQSISSAIIASMEHANRLEASRKKLYSLDIQRSRLMYLRMEQVISSLYTRYPELKTDPNLADLSARFKTMVYNDLNNNSKLEEKSQQKSAIPEDPIKKLLHNIIACFDNNKKTEVENAERVSPSPTDELMNHTSKSGFDFNEALHPTMGLEEIMKSFNLTVKKKDDKQK